MPPVTPQHAVAAANILPRASHDEDIVEGADEAVFERHILAVPHINAAGVVSPRTHEFQVFKLHLTTASQRDSPRIGITKHNSFHTDVRTISEMNTPKPSASPLVGTLDTAPVEHSPSPNANVVDIIRDQTAIDDRAPGDVTPAP